MFEVVKMQSLKVSLLVVLCTIGVGVVLASPLGESDKIAPVLLKTPSSRIILGNPASKGQFPWQAAVIANRPDGGRSFCGGAVINADYILTAAHCALNQNNFTIHLGTLSLTPDFDAINEQSVEPFVHPAYNGNLGAGNDVALLKLTHPIIFNDIVYPIELADSVLPANVNLTVSGWGKTSDASTGVSNSLNFVNLISITNTDCSNFFNGLTANVLCAVGPSTSSTCNGDSGGAIVINAESSRPIHVGVVSFVSTRGCEAGYPSGYTRTQTVREWIRGIAGV